MQFMLHFCLGICVVFHLGNKFISCYGTEETNVAYRRNLPTDIDQMKRHSTLPRFSELMTHYHNHSWGLDLLKKIGSMYSKSYIEDWKVSLV